MLRSTRYTIDTTPTRIDISLDDNQMGREITVIAQGDGIIVVCEDADSYTTGARIHVTEGSTIEFRNNSPIWLASPLSIDVDVIEEGVA